MSVYYLSHHGDSDPEYTASHLQDTALTLHYSSSSAHGHCANATRGNTHMLVAARLERCLFHLDGLQGCVMHPISDITVEYNLATNVVFEYYLLCASGATIPTHVTSPDMSPAADPHLNMWPQCEQSAAAAAMRYLHTGHFLFPLRFTCFGLRLPLAAHPSPPSISESLSSGKLPWAPS